MACQCQNELYHHGVKGMKWGVRKDNKIKTANNAPRKKSYRKIQVAIAIGSQFTKAALKRYGSDKMATIGPGVVTIGSAATNVALSVKAHRENKKNRINTGR